MSLTYQKEPKKERPEFNRAYALVFVFLAVLVIGVLIFYKPQSTENRPKITNAEIFRLSSQEPITKDFVSRYPEHSAKISLLNLDSLKSLAKEFPAIYGNLPQKELYKVEYSAGSEGIFLIIDPDNGVLKYYRVKNFGLS